MSDTRGVHPLRWTLLIMPFGAVGGFVGVAMNFFGTKHGLSVEETASLTAIGLLPHTWKFAWAPVVDMTLTRRRWYLVSAVLCIIGTIGMAAIPLHKDNLNLMRTVIFVTNLATTTLGMAVEGLMAHLTPEEERGRAGGWFQAGNLGGGGIGGGLAFWLMQVLPQAWMSGAILGGTFLLCALGLRGLPDVVAEGGGGGVGAAVSGVFQDLKSVFLGRAGLLAALICFLPIGTGAASGVLAQAEVAALWGAGEEEVMTANGVLSGIVMMVGSLAGGELCRRFSPRAVYIGVGVLMAVVALIMALGPATVPVYVGGLLTYAFVVGLAYAAFTGLVLATIGAGAAATKYNIYAALSNTPIMYMGLVLAWVAGKEGAAVSLAGSAPRIAEWLQGDAQRAMAMLGTEAGTGLLGALLFIAVAALVNQRRAEA